jgi:hypothetical protein
LWYLNDRYGNGTGHTVDGQAATIDVNPATNRLTMGYEYDAIGNVIRDESGKRYRYDQENRLNGEGLILALIERKKPEDGLKNGLSTLNLSESDPKRRKLRSFGINKNDELLKR